VVLVVGATVVVDVVVVVGASVVVDVVVDVVAQEPVLEITPAPPVTLHQFVPFE
jgi:hypothetical protein